MTTTTAPPTGAPTAEATLRMLALLRPVLDAGCVRQAPGVVRAPGVHSAAPTNLDRLVLRDERRPGLFVDPMLLSDGELGVAPLLGCWATWVETELLDRGELAEPQLPELPDAAESAEFLATWFGWLREAHPERAARLSRTAAVTLVRLARLVGELDRVRPYRPRCPKCSATVVRESWGWSCPGCGSQTLLNSALAEQARAAAPLATTEEVAEAVGLTPRRIQQLHREGVIPAAAYRGSRPRYDVETVKWALAATGTKGVTA